MRFGELVLNLLIAGMLFAAFLIETDNTEDMMKFLDYFAAFLVVIGAALSMFPNLLLFNFRWFFIIGSSIFCYTTYKQQQWPWFIVNASCIFFYILGAILLFV